VDEVSVPVSVDAIRRSGEGSPLARCTYFTIELQGPSAGWTLELQAEEVPFLLLQLAGVVTSPVGGGDEFASVSDIDRLLAAVERGGRLTVDLADVWLPKWLLGKRSPVPPHRGQVYRAGERIFRAAIEYRDGRLGPEALETLAEELGDTVRFAEGETRAFSLWRVEQIRRARGHHPKNRKLQLEWDDSKTNAEPEEWWTHDHWPGEEPSDE